MGHTGTGKLENVKIVLLLARHVSSVVDTARVVNGGHT